MPCLPLFLSRHNNALNRLLPMRIYRQNKKNYFGEALFRALVDHRLKYHAK